VGNKKAFHLHEVPNMKWRVESALPRLSEICNSARNIAVSSTRVFQFNEKPDKACLKKNLLFLLEGRNLSTIQYLIPTEGKNLITIQDTRMRALPDIFYLPDNL